MQPEAKHYLGSASPGGLGQLHWDRIVDLKGCALSAPHGSE